MNESKRQQKFSRLLQKDLGDIFQRNTRGILGKEFVTVSHVAITPDLSFAKVYLSMMMVPNKEELITRINDRKSEIRKDLGNLIGKQVRIIPDLRFYIDEVEERAARLDALIDSLDIPPAPEEDKNDSEKED
jgi:ribosome-binding factor A